MEKILQRLKTKQTTVAKIENIETKKWSLQKKTKKQRNRHGKNFTKVENKTKTQLLQKLKIKKKNHFCKKFF